MKTYKHPQGKVIVVHDNGTMTCTKNGKPATSSATVEKLARGHGGWVEVANADGPPPAMPEAPPSGGAVRSPMRFQQADEATLLAAVTNPDWWFQQKLDGVRAQLVVSPTTVWARATSGEALKSTVAGPVAARVIKSVQPDGEAVVLDGEILNGQWWMFDLTVDLTQDRTPYEERLERLMQWVLDHPDVSSALRVLPTAYTTDEKAALLERVVATGGEGVLLKHSTSPYQHDARVTHSLKYKVTHTVDVVVVARNVNGRDSNATLGLYQDGNLCAVGSTSMIGKGEADVGDVLEVRYLYAGAGGRLVQPTVLRKRTDKAAANCTSDQLVFANKEVLT